MSDQCFNSYVKTFEKSLGNESELVFKENNTIINATIYGELINMYFFFENQGTKTRIMRFKIRTH